MSEDQPGAAVPAQNEPLEHSPMGVEDGSRDGAGDDAVVDTAEAPALVAEAPAPPATSRATRRRRLALALRALAAVVLLAILVLAGLGAWAWDELQGSLPHMSGRVVLAGLGAAVTVERDALGVPTVRAHDRLDAARALGFLHAQERFFQMDLLRRQPAGELAELFGRVALDSDRRMRSHRFRAVARRTVAALPADQRRLLDAYTAGVNAGLAALATPPWEYVLLRSRPRPWRLEDTVLAVDAMFVTLQDEDGRLDSDRGLLRDVLGPAVEAFLDPPGTSWDAPVVGGALSPPPIPGPDVLDLRREPPLAHARLAPVAAEPERFAVGSNSFAIAASRTAHGGALLANDMHLGISVPNTWYRASLEFPDATAPGGVRKVTGVTLPGTPAMVVGSNGEVAWGFTNSYGDYTDLVELEPGPPAADGAETYRTPQGPRRFEHVVEEIAVRGAAPERLEVLETIWGPVVDRDHAGHRRAVAWTAQLADAVNLEGLGLETAHDVEQAVAIANRAGIPAQNFVVADSGGRIAWTIMGRIPRRFGFDGSMPTSWADGSRGWNGWLAPEEAPRILDPPGGRLWTANARVVDGVALAALGDGGYDLGARAQQIRDDLAALEGAAPSDLLAIQLDDRALFLARWQELLLGVLTPQAVAADPRRAERAPAWSPPGAVARRSTRPAIAWCAPSATSSPTRCSAPSPPRRRQPTRSFRPRRFQQEEGPLWAARHRTATAPPGPALRELGPAAPRRRRRHARQLRRPARTARLPHLGRTQHDAHRPPARRRPTAARSLARHAGAPAARRQ